MISKFVRDTSYFMGDGELNKYKEKCIADPDNSGLSLIYRGSGISQGEHPLKDRINFYECGNCKNKNTKIIYAKWVVHPMSGDVYWDYEMHCEKCGKYTTYSYAEND